MSQAARPDRPTWLVVEDERSDRQILELAVARADVDLDLVIVEDGRSCLRHLDESPDRPSMIMLDLNLPDIPGTEVLAEIRENPLTMPIPVLVLSGSKDQRLIDTAYRNGANAYFVKPETLDGSVELVARLYAHWHVAAMLPR